MKCDRCGYESYEKYCPMCGYKMPDYKDINSNPYIKKDNTEHFVNNYGANTTNNDSTQFNTAPSNVNTPPNYNGNQMKSADEDFSQNGYQNFQQNVNPNVSGDKQVNYTQPYNNVNFQGINQPQPYSPQYYQNGQSNKKSRVVPIVIACLVLLVIVAGAALGIWSSYRHNHSLLDNFFNEDNYDMYGYEPDYEYYYDDPNMIEDNQVYKVDEIKELPNCEVKFLGAERVEDTDKNKSGNSRVTITFEIKNTTDRHVTLDYIYCDVYEANDLKYPDVYYDWLGDNLTEDSTFELAPNETKKLTMDYAVPNNVDDLNIDLNVSCYKDNYDFYGYFTTKK